MEISNEERAECYMKFAHKSLKDGHIMLCMSWLEDLMKLLEEMQLEKEKAQ